MKTARARRSPWQHHVRTFTAADVTAFLTEVIAKQAIVVNGSPVTAIKKIYIEDVDEKVLA